MNEKNAFDLLVDFAKKHGFTYETHEDRKRFLLSPSDPTLNTKSVVFRKGNLLFCASDSFAAKAQTSSTWSGLYGEIDLPEYVDLKINRKDWLDRFLKSNKRKTGNSYFDSKLTVTSKSEKLPQRIKSSKLADYFLKLSETTSPIEVIIKFDYLENLNQLKGKMVVGVEIRRWMYEEHELENFLHYAGLMIESIRSKGKVQ